MVTYFDQYNAEDALWYEIARPMFIITKGWEVTPRSRVKVSASAIHMKSKSVIIAETDVLLELAEADRLDDLLRTGQQVLISDMIMFLLQNRPETPLIRGVTAWIARHRSGQINIVTTEIFEEFGMIAQVRPQTKPEGRDERAACEIVRLELARGVDSCILLFASSDVKAGNFLVHPPDSVRILSMRAYLEGG